MARNKNNLIEKQISDETFSLIMFFIESNTALAQFKSQFLINILKTEVKLFSYYTFRHTVLPAIMDKMNKCIESKLNNASAITLIVDGWTGQFSNMSYLALAAKTINSSFDHELLIIGMLPMPISHTSENLGKAIEKMVNAYSFDYNKIYGMISDEGRNLTALLVQLIPEDLDNTLFPQFETIDDDEDHEQQNKEQDEENVENQNLKDYSLVNTEINNIIHEAENLIFTNPIGSNQFNDFEDEDDESIPDETPDEQLLSRGFEMNFNLNSKNKFPCLNKNDKINLF